MAGASVIAAVANALGREFPFVFGGDGASFAVPPQWADTSRTALAATLSLVREELSLELRGAMVPVTSVRENGFDVRIARFAPSARQTKRKPQRRVPARDWKGSPFHSRR